MNSLMSSKSSLNDVRKGEAHDADTHDADIHSKRGRGRVSLVTSPD